VSIAAIGLRAWFGKFSIAPHMAGDEQTCPRCSGREVQTAGVLRRHVNPWVYFFGGWLISLLWSGSRKDEVRCVQCDTVFQRSTPASKVAWVLLILLIGLILLGLWAEIFGGQLAGGD
jgi:hypothetical protein